MGGSVYGIPHWIWEKVLSAIYVEAFLNSADAF